MPLVFGGRNLHLGGSPAFRRAPSLLAKISSTFISCALLDSDSAQLVSPMDLPCTPTHAARIGAYTAGVRAGTLDARYKDDVWTEPRPEADADAAQ